MPGSAGRKAAAGPLAAGLAEIGQVAVAVFGVACAGPLLDDDFDGVSLVFVEHVVNAADGRGTDCAPTGLLTALPDDRDDERRRDQPDQSAHVCDSRGP